MTRPGVRVIRLPTPADTRALGARLGAVLRAGDLVVLSGPVGAGKTVLASGIADGMNVTGAVTSPTFVIAHEHPPRAAGGVALIHVDAYRLDGLAELDDLDLDTDLADAAVVVEWGAGLVERLAPEHLVVELTRGDHDEVRTATLSGPRRLVVG